MSPVPTGLSLFIMILNAPHEEVKPVENNPYGMHISSPPQATAEPLAMHTDPVSERQVMSSGSILNPNAEDLEAARERWSKEREEIFEDVLDEQGLDAKEFIAEHIEPRLADFPGPRQVAKI